jgi:hypothetical protein
LLTNTNLRSFQSTCVVTPCECGCKLRTIKQRTEKQRWAGGSHSIYQWVEGLGLVGDRDGGGGVFMSGRFLKGCQK